MKDLQRRIEVIEKEIKARTGGMFTVHYKDGSSKLIRPGSAIELALYQGNIIDRFEEEDGGANDGVLEGLVNALLLPGEDGEREDE